MTELHPALPFFLAAFMIPFVSRGMRNAIQIAAPMFSLALLFTFASQGQGEVHKTLTILGYPFYYFRLDKLSLLFSLTFIVFAFLGHLYSLHAPKRALDFASNLYAGSAVACALAGDLITLFIFWELMALASVVLIWNKDRPASGGAMIRYLLVHLTGGLFFFSGLLIRLINHESPAFQPLVFDTGGWLIFIAFCINAAVVPLHAWLPDAYPEGTPSGSVYLSAFTTKVAVYAFARGFAGSDLLIWLGAIAAVYGVVYALMENDMRRLLSYHIVCQIGYMLCGIGIGSELGTNGGTAHAVGNILFKGLLFMATGAIIHSTGKYKLSDLGGLARESRLLLFFYFVGALAISGAPFLNGYVSKSLLLKAAGYAHLEWLEWLLLFVAVGTFMSIALKLAYFAFWGEKTQTPFVQPIPINMNLAMAGTAFLCVAIGLFPDTFYRFLPYAVHAHVYTTGHVTESILLLLGTTLAFFLILPKLHTKAVITLDVDWLYRKGAGWFLRGICTPLSITQSRIQQQLTETLARMDGRLNHWFPGQNISSVAWPLVIASATSFAVGLFIFLLAFASHQ